MAFRRIVAAVSAMCLLSFATQSASAGVIATADVIAAGDRGENIERIQRVLNDDMVRNELIAQGVDPDDAIGRVASLSDEELAMVAANLDKLPAGGDGVLAVIGIVFVVLFILEITGVTDIFKRV